MTAQRWLLAVLCLLGAAAPLLPAQALANSSAYLSLQTGSASWPARQTATLSFWGGQLFMIGGQANDGTFLNDVWVSGDLGNTWNSVGVSGLGACSEGVQVQAFGQFIIWCGATTSSGASNALYLSSDYQLASWSGGSAPWPARKLMAASVFACPYNPNSVVMVGGLSYSGSTKVALNDVWLVQVNGNYQQLTATNSRNGNSWFSPRWGHETATDAAGAVMVLTGGYTQTSTSYLNDVWSLTMQFSNPPIMTWTQLTTAASFAPRDQHVMWSINDYIYVASGYLNNYLFNDVWVTPDHGVTWLLVSGAANYPPRLGSAVATSGRAVVLASGAVSVGSTSDVWVGFQ